MKTLRTSLSILTLSLMAFCSASAQQAVAPPPKPADSGPSLEVTLQFIASKINSIGPIVVADNYHDNQENTDRHGAYSYEFSNATANVSACLVSYHEKWKSFEHLEQQGNYGIPFGQVKDVIVFPIEQMWKHDDTAGGHPEFTDHADPPVFVVRVRRQTATLMSFTSGRPAFTQRRAKKRAINGNAGSV